MPLYMHLEFHEQLWLLYSKKNIVELGKIHNRAIQIIKRLECLFLGRKREEFGTLQFFKKDMVEGRHGRNL